MAISWAYSLDSDKSLINNFVAAAAGDTVATQTNGTAGAYTPAKGDIVSFNDQGRVSKAKTAVPTGKTNPYIEATAILGICEGGEFTGLAAGGTYAASTANHNYLTDNTIAKVHTSTTDVYRIDMLSGATAPVIGSTYSIVLDPTNGAQLDTANPSGATTIFRVAAYDSTKSQAFGVFTSLELVS